MINGPLLQSEDFPVYIRGDKDFERAELVAHQVISAELDRRPLIGSIRRYLAHRAFEGTFIICEGINIDETVESYVPPSDYNVARRTLEEITLRNKYSAGE